MKEMSNDLKLGIGIGIVIGAVAGIASTAAFFKKLYSDAAKKKIDAVVECYAAEPVSVNPIKNEDVKDYIPVESPVPEPTVYKGNMTVITKDDWEENLNYSKAELVYYDDGILTNEYDIPYTDDELFETFGLEIHDILNGVANRDVYLRDEANGIDYMISPGHSNFNPD